MPKKSMEERKYEAYLAEKKELEAEIDEIEAEKKEIEAKIDQIDEKIGSLDVEISKLRMQVLGKKGEFTASAKLDLEEFQEKKRKLEKRNDSLEKDKDNLEKRIQILTGTRFSHFAEEQIADIVSSVILGVKRAFEGSEAGSSASKISSSCEEDLKKKILPIYSKCPFYGSPAEACEASHIIPYSYANHPFTAHTWESDYRIHCSEWKDGIQDVRNGILMDKHYFTIRRIERPRSILLEVEVGQNWHPDDRKLASLHKKRFKFPGKKANSPHPEFLAYHNAVFDHKQKTRTMKATAKPKELCQDTDATLSTGCIDPFTAKWIEEQQSIQAYEPINEMIELE